MLALGLRVMYDRFDQARYGYLNTLSAGGPYDKLLLDDLLAEFVTPEKMGAKKRTRMVAGGYGP